MPQTKLCPTCDYSTGESCSECRISDAIEALNAEHGRGFVSLVNHANGAYTVIEPHRRPRVLPFVLSDDGKRVFARGNWRAI